MTAGRGGSNRGYKNTVLDAYFWTDDVDALYTDFQHSGAGIVRRRSFGFVAKSSP